MLRTGGTQVREGAFTMIEMLVAMIVIGILLAMMSQLVADSTRGGRTLSDKRSAQIDAQGVIEYLREDAAGATAPGRVFVEIDEAAAGVTNPATCASDTCAAAVASATPTQAAFRMMSRGIDDVSWTCVGLRVTGDKLVRFRTNDWLGCSGGSTSVIARGLDTTATRFEYVLYSDGTGCDLADPVPSVDSDRLRRVAAIRFHLVIAPGPSGSRATRVSSLVSIGDHTSSAWLEQIGCTG